MDTIPLLPDFRDFLKFLNDEEVQYLVVGGMAVNLYGYHRATGDMDIWVAVTAENENRLARSLERFGFSSQSVANRPIIEKPKFIRIGEKPIRVEILSEVSGVDFDDCFARRNTVSVDGLPVNFIHLEDLRTNKHAVGRTKDKADLENLPTP